MQLLISLIFPQEDRDLLSPLFGEAGDFIRNPVRILLADSEGVLTVCSHETPGDCWADPPAMLDEVRPNRLEIRRIRNTGVCESELLAVARMVLPRSAKGVGQAHLR